MIKKIDHINISVTDLYVCTRFFTELLGFTMIHEGELTGEWIDAVVGLSNVKSNYVQMTLPGTETNLELIQYHNPAGHRDPQPDQPNQIGFRHMAFNVQNIEEQYENLKEKGVKVFRT